MAAVGGVVWCVIEHTFPTDFPATALECVEELEEIERLQSALCGRQARLTARLDETSVRTTTSEKAMATEVGLARHESPHRGARLLKLGRVLVEDHPEVLALLDSGDLNERRAELIIQETADLALGDRRAADRAIAAHLFEQRTLGDRDLVDLARRIVLRIDATAAHERAVLLRHQDDERTRAQLLADLFVERLAGELAGNSVPVLIDLIMPVETFLGDGSVPGEIPGPGPIPASVARNLAHASPATRTRIRRLFADTDHLVAMESTSRTFDGLLRQLIRLRDRRCRTPWCDAPIRHLDHIADAAEGGPTSLYDGQGLCEACNYTKQDHGITHEVISEDVIEPHATWITTPTGAGYHSRAPAPPGTNPRDHFIERQPGVWTRVA